MSAKLDELKFASREKNSFRENQDFYSDVKTLSVLPFTKFIIFLPSHDCPLVTLLSKSG